MTNEVPHDDEQAVESQQPHEENNEPQHVRRSLRERRSSISNDYVVYIS
jgi:hypothetical protein